MRYDVEKLSTVRLALWAVVILGVVAFGIWLDILWIRWCAS